MGRHAHNGAISVRDKSMRVRQAGDDVGVVEAHKRFGGFDLPASLAGTLCALGLAVLLAGILAGVGTIGYQSGVADTDTTLSGGGLIGGLAVLFLAFLTGGWVAGRMARYDGARNGLMTAVWFLLLAAVVSVLGAWWGDKYDFYADLNLPQWFSDNARTTTALVSGVVGVVVMLLAGLLGGVLGARYHRRADDVIVHSRAGGIVADRVEVVDSPLPPPNPHTVDSAR
jgi:hypothetical protein